METTVNFVAVTIIYLLIGLFVAFAVWVIYRNHIKKGEKEFQQSIEEDKKLNDTSDPLVKKEGITKGKHVIVPNKIVIEVSPDKTEVDIYNFHIPNKKNILLTIFDGTSYMPINAFDVFEGYTHYHVSVPVENFTSIGKTLTLDKIQFKLVNKDGKEIE